MKRFGRSSPIKKDRQNYTSRKIRTAFGPMFPFQSPVAGLLQYVFAVDTDRPDGSAFATSHIHGAFYNHYYAPDHPPTAFYHRLLPLGYEALPAPYPLRVRCMETRLHRKRVTFYE